MRKIKYTVTVGPMQYQNMKYGSVNIAQLLKEKAKKEKKKVTFL